MSCPLITRVIMRLPTSGQAANPPELLFSKCARCCDVKDCNGNDHTCFGSSRIGSPYSKSAWPRAFFSSTLFTLSASGYHAQRDSPETVLYSLFDLSICALSFSFLCKTRAAEGMTCLLGSDEPAITQPRKATRYSSSRENP